VTLWRGVWLLLNMYFISDNLELSAGATHAMGIVVLWLMLCAHSITVSGCTVDGESPVEEACLTPNFYLRVFMSKPRRTPVVFVADNNMEVVVATDIAAARCPITVNSDYS